MVRVGTRRCGRRPGRRRCRRGSRVRGTGGIRTLRSPAWSSPGCSSKAGPSWSTTGAWTPNHPFAAVSAATTHPQVLGTRPDIVAARDGPARIPTWTTSGRSRRWECCSSACDCSWCSTTSNRTWTPGAPVPRRHRPRPHRRNRGGHLVPGRCCSPAATRSPPTGGPGQDRCSCPVARRSCTSIGEAPG
jgi:hypothetical protein